MEQIPDNIIKFLNSNKVATVCFSDNENNPYCINCFFFFDEDSNSLVAKSSAGSTHHGFMEIHSNVAGTILPETLDAIKIKGVQFNGKLVDDLFISKHGLAMKYTKKYLMSMAIPGYMWAIQLTNIKFTDNTLGFGNKTVWKNNE